MTKRGCSVSPSVVVDRVKVLSLCSLGTLAVIRSRCSSACKAPPSITMASPVLKSRLHHIQLGLGDILRCSDAADRRAGADALECRPPPGFGRSMPEFGVDRAPAHSIDPERPEFGGQALHHALETSEDTGIDPLSRRRPLGNAAVIRACVKQSGACSPLSARCWRAAFTATIREIATAKWPRSARSDRVGRFSA